MTTQATMRDSQRPAIYLLDDERIPEANGQVYHFCGLWCREKFSETLEDAHMFGVSEDWIKGTVCEHCGMAL